MINMKTLVGIGLASFLGAFSAIIFFNVKSSEIAYLSNNSKRMCDCLYFNSSEYELALNNFQNLDPKVKTALIKLITRAKNISKTGDWNMCYLESIKVNTSFTNAKINLGYQEEWPAEG